MAHLDIIGSGAAGRDRGDDETAALRARIVDLEAVVADLRGRLAKIDPAWAACAGVRTVSPNPYRPQPKDAAERAMDRARRESR